MLDVSTEAETKNLNFSFRQIQTTNGIKIFEIKKTIL